MTAASEERGWHKDVTPVGPAFTESVIAAVVGARRILVSTDDGRRPAYGSARRAAVGLAELVGAELVLYDRSAESWFVESYSSGGVAADVEGPDAWVLLTATDVRPLGRAYLADQIREAAEHRVVARAWLPQHHGARSVEECASRFHADVVVLPDVFEHPSVVDRMRRRPVADLATSISVPTLLVGPDGQVRVAGAWRVDRAASSLRFEARQFGFLRVGGRFTDYLLDLDFDEAVPTRSSVAARIGARSIRTGIGICDRQLRSARFLDADSYPDLRFTSSAIEQVGGRFRIHGDLDVTAARRPVTLEARIEPTDRDDTGRRRVRFRATTTLAWRDWDIPGVFFAGPELTIEIDVLATQVGDDGANRKRSLRHFTGASEPSIPPTAPAA